MPSKQFLLLIALGVSGGISVFQWTALRRWEARAAILAARPASNLDSTSVRQENKRLRAEKSEADDLLAASRELPALRLKLETRTRQQTELPQQAAAEDEASLSPSDRLLRRLQEAGLWAMAEQDFPTLLLILKDPALLPKLDLNELNQLRSLDPSKKAQLALEVVPAAAKALADEDQATRWAAASLLGILGPQAKSAVPDLLQALETRRGADWGFQMRAASALGMIGPDAKEAVPALVRALQSDPAHLRASAALALGLIGPEAHEAVATLSTAVHDPDQWVHQSAEEALRRISPHASNPER